MTEYQGFYENMDFDEYAAVDAMNGSKIVHMRRSPMKFKHERENPSQPTPAMNLGVLVHRMILEPKTMGTIAVWGTLPEQKVRNGKVWDAFREANEGKTIMTVKELDECEGMATSALNNKPIAKYAAAKGPTELSMFWKHPHGDRRWKARIDKLIPETDTIFDLKSTVDCHSYRFGSTSYRLGYHIKLALYFDGYRILTGREPKVIMGAVDSKAPHESAVYRVTKDVIQQGLEELGELVLKLDECEGSKKWPAEHDEETDLILPSWTTTQDGDGEDDFA